MTTLIAGIEYPNMFSKDLIALRRANTGAGVPYDPESLLTGADVISGFTYTNSRRRWASQADYAAAVSGNMTTADILVRAPRVPTLTTYSRVAVGGKQ